MKGRKRKPTELKKQIGTYKDCRNNPNEPKLPISIPNMPKYFDEFAKEAFEFLGVKAFEMRILTEADKLALELLSESYSEYRKAINIIKEEGMTYKVIDSNGNINYKARPENIIKDKAMNRMKSLIVEFGFTPSSRARVNSQKEGPIDTIAELID
jgi:P27 family predicted phage terminase small subunit|tara:strand:+ start:36 stop:500 length:465 start_codon:yes stop_codon:yes gene_type:complete